MILLTRWPEEQFEEMDSTLAVQQYIQQTIRKDSKGNISAKDTFLYFIHRIIFFAAADLGFCRLLKI
jgi:hypothetical protein